MELIDKDTIIKDIPLFAELSRKEKSILKERMHFVEYKKSQVIYEERAPADAFYAVVLGRVVIFTKGPGGNDVILEYLHRGKYFGIISLLTGDSHSVTAKAINDCLLLVIAKEDFDFILKKIPRIAIDLSRMLSRRLKRRDIRQKTIFESTVISVFSSYSGAGKSLYAASLGFGLKSETHKSVIILDISIYGKAAILPSRLRINQDYKVLDLDVYKEMSQINNFILKDRNGIEVLCFYYRKDSTLCLKNIIAILSSLVNDYHYILFDLPAEMDGIILEVLHQSDLIQLITSPEPSDLELTRGLIEKLKSEFHFPESKINVLINEYRTSKLTHDEQRELLGHPMFATLPKVDWEGVDALALDKRDSDYAKALRRISRQLGECQVGLALGVGLAYGFCHIGVLRVIEEEKIPIDVIVGSSIGAVVGGLWATGRSSREILQITAEFKEPKYIWNLVDFTFSSIGFIKGNKLYKFLKKHFGNMTFHDVRLPLKIVASDIRRKESRIIEEGPLADAIMRSCAMPGVFIPFGMKGELLLDGGVIHPLPTEPLFKMGVKKIIAVNVTPSREDILRQYEEIKEAIGSIKRGDDRGFRFNLRQYIRSKFKINILNLVFNSFELMQSEIAQKEAQLADVVLHPDTQGLYWLELHKAEEFAKRGEEEARRHLDRIWQVINE